MLPLNNVDRGFWARGSAAGDARLVVDNSEAAANLYGFYAGGGTFFATLWISNSLASHNRSYGVIAAGGGNGGAVLASNCIAQNKIGGDFFPGGQNSFFYTYGNNVESAAVGTFSPISLK